MSILGQMYRNIAVHCFEGETLFICFGHFVAEHLQLTRDKISEKYPKL